MGDKVMAVVGSRTESAGMQAETTKATNKALSAGWRVSTGGARGTDATAIRAAVDAGKSNKLDVYLPARINDQPVEVRALLDQAKAGGANIVENSTGKAIYDANGKCTNYTKLLNPRNTEIIKNSDAAVIMQNNQSRGSQDALTKALKEIIPIKRLTFTEGILKTVSKFNLGLGVLGLVGQFLDYEEYTDSLKETQDLIDKWKKGTPDYTPEDAKKLKERGYQNTDMPYNDKDLTEVDPDKYYGNHGTGNPYHDSEGKFCSADQSVTTCWS